MNTQALQYDDGLRQYMTGIYNRMTGGLLLTGVVAYILSITGFIGVLSQMPILLFLFILAPLGFVMAMSFGVERFDETTLNILFWSFSAVNGVGLGLLFGVFTSASIMQALFMAASIFAGMSLYGYTTKRNLEGWGSFLLVGLIGIIIASVINLFIGSSMVTWVVSVIAILIFTGLTAYDTQRLKEMYDPMSDLNKIQTMGALSLYLNFYNIFVSLLQLFGNNE